ncbi:probable inactive peptidyl-prolyl cis-trans isomerase-like 6 isoform X2 [Octopus sinensis]|uniref:Probable inactive peptidyl-prolyl cis-trans isomerase-like 6 isoform X2 n=1 Tax=Octopus sinensis TaxID=2607531 RepID=A0A7E6FLI2_9MOLL|nr:probable inactive peptidyl-prolyl cis-trans isomerase-like 6 isoform X2 [Octopus sinensis]
MATSAKNYKVVIYGLIDSMNFKRAQYCAQKMEVDFPETFKKPDIVPMFEFEWEEFIEKQKKLLQGEMWIYDKNELVFINDKMLGSYDDLLYWADYSKFYDNNLPYTLFSALVEEDYRNELIKRNHDFIYMYISIDDIDSGFFLIELFNDILPKTCENFKTLCVGNTPMARDPLRKLTYEGSFFHRIVPNGWIQGGDVCDGRGNDGESIFGGEFEDENFCIPFNKRGVLGMANHGRHTNSSQFFITLVETPWMNHKYVAFGQLLEGTELLQTLEEEQTFNERPIKPLRIYKCEAFNFTESITHTPPSNMSGSIHVFPEGDEDAEKEHSPGEQEDAADIPENVTDEPENTVGVTEDVENIPEDAEDAPKVGGDTPDDEVNVLDDAFVAPEELVNAPEEKVEPDEKEQMPSTEDSKDT